MPVGSVLKRVTVPLYLQARHLRGVLHHEAKRLKEILSDATDLPPVTNIGYGMLPKSRSFYHAKKRILRGNRFDPMKEADLGSCVAGRDLYTQYDRIHMARAARHYRVFEDLFRGEAEFLPCVRLNVLYPSAAECDSVPVCSGNILPGDITMNEPHVSVEVPANIFGDQKFFYTLCLTSLDCHLTQPNAEYIHWIVSNIPDEGDFSKGETVCKYLPPFVPHGTGYHRFVFLLFKHSERLQLTLIDEGPKASLAARTFDTFEFYKDFQDIITPVGLAFLQSCWHDRLVEVYHDILEMRVPEFAFSPARDQLPPAPKYPKDIAFNEFMDRYRDPKEVVEEVYVERLRSLEPFRDEPPPQRFPHLEPIPKDVPTWLYAQIVRKRNRIGKYVHLTRPSIYGSSDYEDPKERAHRQDVIYTEKLRKQLLEDLS